MLVALALRREPDGTRRPARIARDAIVLAIAFLVPTAVWTLVVEARTGSFYSHEAVEFRMFLWIVDAWRVGWDALARESRLAVVVFAAKTWDAIREVAAVTLVVTLLAAALGPPLGRSLRAERPIVLSAGLTFVTIGGFLWLMGAYMVRMSWSLAPPLLAVAGALVVETIRSGNPRRTRPLTTALVVASAVCLALVLFREPPYLRWAAGRQLADMPRFRRYLVGTPPPPGPSSIVPGESPASRP
jgi:hypothetical protein